MNTPETIPHVYTAINAVQAALAKEGITKSRKNQQQGYAFRGIDEIYNTLSHLLAEHQLVILPTFTERTITEREAKSGGALFGVTVRGEFTFVSAKDASTAKAATFGEAMDSADKATNKAMSAAYKYACLQAFCIPTEGDNDADAHTHEPAARRAAPAADRSPSSVAPTRAEVEPTNWKDVIVPKFIKKYAGKTLGDMDPKDIIWWAENYVPKPFQGVIPETDKAFRRSLDAAQAELSQPAGAGSYGSDDVPM